MVRLQALETEQSESRMAETQRSIGAWNWSYYFNGYTYLNGITGNFLHLIGHEQEMHALMQQMESDQETARELMSINNSLKTQIEELRVGNPHIKVDMILILFIIISSLIPAFTI